MPSGRTERWASKRFSTFLYKPQYSCRLADKNDDADVLVYGSTGFRTFYHSNPSLLRVTREFRNLIVAELTKLAEFRTVVHLRGTDANGPAQHDAYLEKLPASMANAD